MKKKFKVRLVPRQMYICGFEIIVYVIQYAYYRFIPMWHTFNDRQTLIESKDRDLMEKKAKDLKVEDIISEKERIKNLNKVIKIK